MTLSQISLRTLLATTALAGTTAIAMAAPAIGLVGGTTLVSFDTETLAVTGTMDVTGVDGLAGIDVRPADQTLYGVSLAGEIVTIDPATGAATVNQNVEPLPSSLSTPIWPPIISTSRLQMARPSPVPPYLRVVDASTCMKAWNSELTRSGGMPMPVSVTLNSMTARPCSSDSLSNCA